MFSQDFRVTGIKINYLFVCERKLWLFDRGIGMEHTSEKVLLGKLLDEFSYPKEKKRRVLIDDLISIDILNEDEIREIKYSNKLEEPNRMQILYYLYYLKKLGIQKKGVLNYPKQKRREIVELTPVEEKKIEDAIKRIEEIIKMETPPPVEKKKYCKRCAYYEFCFVRE
ncbi:MAG TPA: CRISPR-associated protein Cas4 [Dictyoglomaceae bacterium]|nr:CRISPR-associated protein Cas4 [Dictyoglomaceae bacterium]HOL39972.1 CRISPR-associated protein Cas4 [Dictyoglomaceae bacterium]HPP16444.1 CRISPR-associated protein Cas4 [Dictyoglomaceae bacterium]